MATQFNVPADHCEGPACREETGVVYYVREKQKLCDGCAEKKGCAIKVGQAGSELICKKHDEIIKFYCKSHDLAACQTCVTLWHRMLCDLEDVKETIAERKHKLRDLAARAKDNIDTWKRHEDDIVDKRERASKHLKSVRNEVIAAYGATLTDEDEKGKNDEDMINRRIDGEIKKMNDLRELELKQSREERAKRRAQIECDQKELLQILDEIEDEAETKLGDFQQQTRALVQQINDATDNTEAILSDNQAAMDRGQEQISSLTETMQKGVEEAGVTGILRTVEGVKFVTCVGDGYRKGTIDWGIWELDDTIKNTHRIFYRMLAGCINEEEVVVTENTASDWKTCVTNINSKESKKVVQFADGSVIASCALLNENYLICGKFWVPCTIHDVNIYLAVYDRQWKLIREPGIPRNTSTTVTRVHVAADNGMILAAEYNQSNIYVIDPTDGRIVSTITCQDKIEMRGVLPSGDIIVQRATDDKTLLVIDRQGRVQRVIRHDEMINASIDHSTGALYVSWYDKEREMCVIDEMGECGVARRVASFPLLSGWAKGEQWRHVARSAIIFTPDGKLIACDGTNILVYRKACSF